MIRVGKRLAIINEAEESPPGLVVVRLKTAPVTPDFTMEGYGWEPATRAMLKEIESSKPHTMLDIGTGTGILAIAAEKFGGSVGATEMYPAKAQHTRANIELNQCSAALYETDELPDVEADLIVANIGWDDWIDGHRRQLKERAPRVLASVSERMAGKARLRIVHRLDGWGVVEL